MSDKLVYRPHYAVRGRYLNDPAFHALVSTLQNCIESAQFTPTEIREAAMLAQILYEERHPRPIVFTRLDVAEGKV